MGDQNGPMIIQFTITILHIFWCDLLTVRLDMEVQGTAIATAITYFLMLSIYHFYTSRFTDERIRKEAWFLPDWKSFKDLSGLVSFMKLGLPSIGMLCLEWWSFELMILYSAYLSTKAVGA